MTCKNKRKGKMRITELRLLQCMSSIATKHTTWRKRVRKITSVRI